MRPVVTDVAWSVCQSVRHNRELSSAETVEPIDMGLDSDGPQELCIRRGPRSPREKSILAIGGSSPLYWEGPSFLGSGARPEGPKSEAQRAESKVGFLGQLGDLEIESTVSSPSRVRGGVPAAKMFSCILEAQHGLSRNLSESKFGGPWLHWPP